MAYLGANYFMDEIENHYDRFYGKEGDKFEVNFCLSRIFLLCLTSKRLLILQERTPTEFGRVESLSKKLHVLNCLGRWKKKRNKLYAIMKREGSLTLSTNKICRSSSRICSSEIVIVKRKES